MTGKVLSFDAAKRAKSAPKKPPAKPKTTQEIFEDVYSDIIDEWQACAIKNGLNEYIRKKIPVHARGTADADFVGDLNVLARAELKLGMKVSVFYPDVTHSNPHGWLVNFHLDKEVYSAPPLMASEAYARALNILLYVELTAQLKKLKRL